MRNLDYRLGVIVTLCAIVGGFLFVVDVGETPSVFENGRAELACFVPAILWLLGRNLHLWPRSRGHIARFRH